MKLLIRIDLFIFVIGKTHNDSRKGSCPVVNLCFDQIIANREFKTFEHVARVRLYQNQNAVLSFI